MFTEKNKNRYFLIVLLLCCFSFFIGYYKFKGNQIFYLSYPVSSDLKDKDKYECKFVGGSSAHIENNAKEKRVVYEVIRSLEDPNLTIENINDQTAFVSGAGIIAHKAEGKEWKIKSNNLDTLLLSFDTPDEFFTPNLTIIVDKKNGVALYNEAFSYWFASQSLVGKSYTLSCH